MRALLIAMLSVSLGGAAMCQQSAQAAAKQDSVVATAAVTSAHNIQVVAMDDTVVINGRLMKVADYLARLSSLDNLMAQRPRTPETSSHETVKPVALPQQTSH